MNPSSKLALGNQRAAVRMATSARKVSISHEAAHESARRGCIRHVHDTGRYTVSPYPLREARSRREAWQRASSLACAEAMRGADFYVEAFGGTVT